MDPPEELPDDDAPAYPPPARPPGRGYTIAAFVCAAIALLVAPVYGGAAGTALGVVGLRKGDPLGKRAIIAAVVAMVIGIVVLVAAQSGNA
ncbi:MAG: hypothetical protein JWO68_82 [Actinomycetia bacterium]|nr:hypothetical protein [Actinomycetes bacterium]